MRILHTADWHLGRYLNGVSLLADQAYVLDQIVELAVHERVDAVFIAGDVHDRSQPPADAVALLDDVLARLVVGAGIAVVVIAGNHDSAERIGFGGRIFARQRLILRGRLDDLSPVRFDDAHGIVAVYPLPYIDPLFVRALPGGAEVGDQQQATAHLLARLRAGFVAGERKVLLAHAFVAGGSESESERPLSVGGSAMVRGDTYAGFDFVALGHLHRPQDVGSSRLHYAGSPLKYSFNEADHRKSVSLVDIGADGQPQIRRVPLLPRRDLRVIAGPLARLLAQPDEYGARDDYLCAHLSDSEPVLDPMARLREVYPNMLELRFAPPPTGTLAARAAGDHRRRQPEELFRAFYRDMLGEDAGEAALAAFNEAARGVAAADAAGDA